MMVEHTPTKYHACHGVHAVLGDCVGIAPAPNEWGDKEAQAHVQFIESAVNNHKALVEALKPFAAFADTHKTLPADMPITLGSSLVTHQLTMGDCYKARAVLAQLTNAMEVEK